MPEQSVETPGASPSCSSPLPGQEAVSLYDRLLAQESKEVHLQALLAKAGVFVAMGQLEKALVLYSRCDSCSCS